MSSRKSKQKSARPAVAAAPPIDRAIWVVWVSLLAVTLAAYAPAWHGGMLWDDDAHLTRATLQSLQGLWRIWFEPGATQQYYPVAHSAFWVMHRLWGDDTLGYHLVNIVLHATSATLVAVILRRLRAPGALLAATIFALHPIQVESVAWMTELKNTLSGALYLGAFLAYLHFDRDRVRRWYVLALALFVLALLAKTVTATLPAALLVVFWWQRGRLSWRDDVVPVLPFFALGISGGLVTAWVERAQIGAEGAAFNFTFIERVLIAGRAFWFYLGRIIWPTNLIFIYPRWHVSQQVWWQYLYPLAALALIAALWRFRTRSRAPLAAALFFAGTLFPALGFLNVYPFIYSFVADHFQYLASLGPIVLGSAGIASLVTRWRPADDLSRLSTSAAAVLLAAAVPLGTLTWLQSRQYADAETLYQTTLARNPSCWMAHINLGKLRLETAGTDKPDREHILEALAEFQSAVQIEPDISQVHNNLGAVFADLGRFDEAKAEYREALQLRPNDSEVLGNLSRAYVQEADALQSAGRLDEAIAEYTQALALGRADADAHNNLGSALAKQGRLPEAIAQYQDALEVNPRSARASNNLGMAYLGAGRVDDAVARFKDAVTFDPDFALAHYNLANALDELGRHDEAVPEYEAAIRVRPDFAEAQNALGVTLAEAGRFADAVPHFREALRLRPDYEDARANLARALAMIK